jgi:hypothetical protein
MWYRSVYGQLGLCYLVAFAWYYISKKRRDEKLRQTILDYERSKPIVTSDDKGEDMLTISSRVEPRRVRIAFPPLTKGFPYAPKLVKSREAYRAKKARDALGSVNTLTKEMKFEPAKVFIATHTSVPEGLRKSWKRIECISVSDYFQTLTSAIAELKWQVNRMGSGLTTDMELLRAFRSAVLDRNKANNYFVSACGLLMSELKDMDTAFRDPDEEEDW